MPLTKVPSNLDATIAITQSQADNSTNIATTAYVDLAISNLADSAPETLNTLNELAAALGDDANYATTTTNAIAAKLPLAGGTMTGAIAMGTAKITGLGDPTANQDAGTKAYIDTADALKAPLASPTFTGTVEIPNLTISSAQGTDGQVLTSTGSGIAWEDAPAGGPTFKTFGTSSIMIGDDATGTINAANYNTGLGVDVFAALTTGDNNVAVGYEALKANTTGADNTALGYQAGLASTNEGNTFIGYRAGKTTTQYQNTLIGGRAGENVTSIRAVSLGYLSMQENVGVTQGDVAVGYLAMQYKNAIDGGSIAIGQMALRGVSNNKATGKYNVAIGQYALQNYTSAANNTAIGQNSLNDITTGSSNIAIGVEAGQYITTGNYNVVLGSYDGNEGGLDIRTASNRVVISDGAGNIRMYINNSGNVGIGTNDPTHTLNTVGASGTSVVQSIRNPNTSWSQYALTRYGTEAADFRYMDFGYYRGATEATRGLVIKSQADATLVTFLDSGNVGIGTNIPAHLLDVNGVIGIRGNPVIDSDGTSHYFKTPSGGAMYFYHGTANIMYVSSAGLLPSTDNARDLGSTSNRWRNLYTTDLHLSNEGKPEGNQVDGTTGNWTIQEGEENLYIINNKSGKKYKFALEEIS